MMTTRTESPGEAIHVVLAFEDAGGTYSQHAGVVMTSVFENTKSPVVFHLLHDDTLTEDNRRKFLRTAEKYGQGVEFHNMAPHIARLGADAVAIVDRKGSRNSTWSVGTLYRLLIPQVLPQSRILYLDCDVLVNLDVRELQDADMEGNALAGVLDFTERERRARLSAKNILHTMIGCDPMNYINAGVLLMDLDRIRASGIDLVAICPRWFARYRHLASYADQDFLNVMFRDSIHLLPDRFNVRDEGHDCRGVIRHIAGLNKPWNGLRDLPCERLYWKMYLKSAWGEDIEPDEFIDLLCGVASRSRQLHLHTSQCWGRILYRIGFDVFCNSLFRTLRPLLREWVFRLRHPNHAEDRRDPHEAGRK